MRSSGRAWRRLPSNNRIPPRTQRRACVRRLSESDFVSPIDTNTRAENPYFSESNNIHDKERANTVDNSSPQLVYHPASTLSKAAGYFGYLSDTQSFALALLKEKVSDGDQTGKLDISSITLSCDEGPSEDINLCLLRFLRTFNFDVEKTLVMLAENVTWRATIDTAKIRSMHPSQVLQLNEDKLRHIISSYYPHWLLGNDRCGHPVLLYSYGKFDTRALLKHTTSQMLELYHVWEQEKNAQLLARRTKELGHIVETYSLVMDVKGLGLGQLTGELIALLRYITDTDSRYYPFRNGTTYIINTPPLFNMVWGTLKGYVEGSSTNIRIFSDKKEWQKVLCEEMGPDQLPPEYGGRGLPLSEIPFLYQYHCENQLQTPLFGTDNFESTDSRTGIDDVIPTELYRENDLSNQCMEFHADRKTCSFMSSFRASVTKSFLPSFSFDPTNDSLVMQLLFPDIVKNSHVPLPVPNEPINNKDSFAVRLLFGSD